MNKLDSSKGVYASIIPASSYVAGSAIASASHAANSVFVDNNSSSGPNKNDAPDDLFGGSRSPVVLSMCPNCSKNQARTRTRTYPTIVTWLGVVVGAVVFFPLCWIPLVVDPMKQTDHYCQNCGGKRLQSDRSQ